MQVTVKGKNTTVPEKVRARAEHKLAKLQRFDDRILAMDVEFSEERNPRVADPHHVEVTLTTGRSRPSPCQRHRPGRRRGPGRRPSRTPVKKLKGRRVDRTQHAEGVKAIPPLPVDELGKKRGHPTRRAGPGRPCGRRQD